MGLAATQEVISLASSPGIPPTISQPGPHVRLSGHFDAAIRFLGFAHPPNAFAYGGLRKRVNLRRELHGAIFEPLRDPVYFAKVLVDPDSRTVAWPNGADFAPDFLYHYEALPADLRH